VAELAAARRLSARGALVRNSSAIEALGRVDVLCFDKTGTLTEGRITLRCVSDGVRTRSVHDVSPQLRAIVGVAVRARPWQAADQQVPHQTDRAILRGARRPGVTADEGQDSIEQLDELPFESGRGYHADSGAHACGRTVAASVNRQVGQIAKGGAVTTMATDTPTIVLVHGAWADATGYGGVIRALRKRGFVAIGVANPLRHLTRDAAYLVDFLRSISGPIVLVGHSYGGAVITNTTTGNEQVKALVYLNGWMPDEGESIQQLIDSEIFEGSLVPPAIRPVPFRNPDGSDGVDFYLDRDAFHEAFARDVDFEMAGVMAATQRPWSAAAAATPSGPPAWRSIPSWYLLGTQDRAIPPAAQRFMAERANAQIEEVAASHASMVSQPEVATWLILTAVEATSRSRP